MELFFILACYLVVAFLYITIGCYCTDEDTEDVIAQGMLWPLVVITGIILFPILLISKYGDILREARSKKKINSDSEDDL